jgi:hypothetical protein
MSKFGLLVIAIALVIGMDVAYLKSPGSRQRRAYGGSVFCARMDGAEHQDTIRIKEPMIKSINALFKTSECPVGQTFATAELTVDGYDSSLLLHRKPSEMKRTENGTVEVVDNFRFHISANDLSRSLEEKKEATVYSDDSKFTLSSDMMDLLEKAETFERDGKVVYKIEMDYDELMKSVSKAGSDLSLADETRARSHQPVSRSYLYDETIMQAADDKVLSELTKSEVTLTSSQDIKPPPLSLTVAEMSRGEIEENLVGTAFVGAVLSLAIIWTNFIAFIIYRALLKLSKKMIVLVSRLLALAI